MFYKWRNIKVVLGELFDPDDRMKNAGAMMWDKYLHRVIIDDRDRGFLIPAFDHLVDVYGEAQFQDAARNFHMALEQYLQSHLNLERAGKLCQGINKILEGRARELV